MWPVTSKDPAGRVDGLWVVVYPGCRGEAVAGKAGGGVGAGESSLAAGEFEAKGAKFGNLPEGKASEGETAGTEEVTSLGPEDGAESPTVGEGVPQQKGGQGHGDIDMPADATEALDLEGTGVAPGKGEGDG